MKKAIFSVLCCLVIGGLAASPVLALPQFKKEFEDKYVKPSNDAAFEAAAKKQSCNVCHVKGQQKNVRNAYGEELAKLIDGDAKDRLAEAKKKGEDAENAEKEKVLKELLAAFGKVEAIKSESGATYGEILKKHMLP